MRRARAHRVRGLGAALPLLALVACGKAPPGATAAAKPPAAAATVAPGAAAAPASPAPLAAPPVADLFSSRALPRLAPGDRRTYAVSGASAAEVNGSPLTQFELNGQLTVTAVEVNDERVLLAATLSSARLTTKLSQLQPEFSKLEGELATPFLFEIAPGGSVAVFRFRDEPSGLVLGVRRWLGAVLQAPPVGPGARWTAEESDATGRYHVRYRTTGAPGRLAREKLRYVDLETRTAAADGAKAPSLLPQIDRSEGTVTLAASGVVDAIEIDEQVRATSAQMLPIVSTTHMALRTTSSGHAGPAALRAARALATEARLFDPKRAAVVTRESPAVDEAHIAGRTLPAVLDGLRRFGGAPLPTEGAAREAAQKEETNLYAALEAMIRRRPGTTKQLVSLINKGDQADVAMIDALGSSGVSEAHSALVALLKARKLDAARLKVAAIALSRTQHPTRESLAGLQDLLDDPGLRVQATYGIGSSIRQLRAAGNVAQAELLLPIIVHRLQGTPDPVQAVTALRAIANSGDENAFPAVEPFFASDNSDIRSAAMEALQLMKHPRVDAVLAEHIASDPFVDVRMAALRAAHLRAPSWTLEQAAIASAQTDKAPGVRLGAVRTLAGWLPARPSLLPILQAIADNETHQGVRSEARNAVLARTAPAGGPRPLETLVSR